MLKFIAVSYLNNVSRIASTRYSPSDDDVIRARLRTIGVQEHRIVLDSGPEPGREWHIFDVGGSRTSRAAWPAYFDDVHAILFLAPVSGFDERLREDRRVNRLDDSLQLWKIVCGHRLLKKTELVLFLNKTDVLERKIAEGIKFNSYVRSYEGPNNADDIVRCEYREFSPRHCELTVQQSPKNQIHGCVPTLFQRTSRLTCAFHLRHRQSFSLFMWEKTCSPDVL